MRRLVGTGRPRTVFVTREIPEPHTFGHLGYMYEIARFLENEGHRLTIVLTDSEPPFRSWELAKHYRSALTRVVGRKVFTAFGTAWRRPSLAGALRMIGVAPPRARSVAPPAGDEEGAPVAVMGCFVEDQEADQVARLIDASKPDFVFFDTIFLSPIARRLQRGARTFVITHDAFHRRSASLTREGYRVVPEGFERNAEAALLGTFDVVIAIQDDEADLFRGMVPGRAVITTSMPVEIRASRPRRVPGRCIFVGSDGVANADGIRWFIAEAWPLVRARRPDSELHIYGRVCDLVEPAAPAGVVLHGFTPDLGSVYDEACVAVAPLRVGSGLKIKLLEYLSSGLACVTTSTGAQGFPTADAPPFLVADSAEDFARDVVLLLADSAKRRRLERRARNYCAAFDRTRTFAALRACLAHGPEAMNVPQS